MFGLKSVCNNYDGSGDVLCTGRLRWFGHVERVEDDNWVKRCMNVTVESREYRISPRKTCEVLCNDLRAKGLNKEDASECVAWRAAIK